MIIEILPHHLSTHNSCSGSQYISGNGFINFSWADLSRLCLNFCCFEGDGLLATKTCLDRERDKTFRDSSCSHARIWLAGGGKGSSLFRTMAGLEWMESKRQQSGHSCWGLPGALFSVGGLYPMEMSEMAGFGIAVKILKGIINLQAVVAGTSGAVFSWFS